MHNMQRGHAGKTQMVFPIHGDCLFLCGLVYIIFLFPQTQSFLKLTGEYVL